MKRFLILAALVLTVGIPAQQVMAQKVQLGVRAGIGTQSFKTDSDSSYEADSRLGWNLAAVSKLRIVGFGSGMLGAGLYVQPEIVYSQNTVKMKDVGMYPQTPGAGGYGDFKTRMSTVDIPLLLSAKVSIVSVQAGPVFNVLTKFNATDSNVEVLPERSAVSYALGASVSLGLITLDGRYHGEFKKLTSSISGGKNLTQSVRGSLHGWSLGVAVMF